MSSSLNQNWGAFWQSLPKGEVPNPKYPTLPCFAGLAANKNLIHYISLTKYTITNSEKQIQEYLEFLHKIGFPLATKEGDIISFESTDNVHLDKAFCLAIRNIWGEGRDRKHTSFLLPLTLEIRKFFPELTDAECLLASHGHIIDEDPYGINTNHTFYDEKPFVRISNEDLIKACSKARNWNSSLVNNIRAAGSKPKPKVLKMFYKSK